MKDIKDIKERVRYFLEKHPPLRESAQETLAYIWWDDLKRFYGQPEKCTMRDFFKLMRDGNLASAESVSRAWRKWQESVPALRGKTWKERHTTKFVEAKEILRDKNNWRQSDLPLPF